MLAFLPVATAKLTSTAVTQTLASVPRGSTIRICNTGANPVHFQWGAAAAVPDATIVDNVGLMTVPAATTLTFSTNGRSGNLSYIAETAGGAVYVSIGELAT